MNQISHRVHELAQQTGRSTKEVLNAAELLGISIPSPTAPIDVDDYQRIRSHLTSESIARQQMIRQRPPESPTRRRFPGTGPHGIRPPAPLRPVQTPLDAPAASPDDRPSPKQMPRQTRRVGPSANPCHKPRSRSEGHPDESIEEAVARMARSKPSRPRRREPLTGLAAFIAQRTGVAASSRDDDRVARTWADQWLVERLFPPDEAMEWMRAGLDGNQAFLATEMRAFDWTPETLSHRVRGGVTVLALVRGGGHSLAQIDAMLRTADGGSDS